MELTAKELEYLNSSEFELEGVKYKAVGINKQDTNIPTCIGCAFDGPNIRKCMAAPQCSGTCRTDGCEVIFVKVEEDAKIDKQASEFEYKGTKYKAIESPDGECSTKCIGWNLFSCTKMPYCSAGSREDKRNVIFVQVVE